MQIKGREEKISQMPWRKVITAVCFLVACSSTPAIAYVFPYLTRVEGIQPPISGLVVKGQSNRGGLEIINKTGKNVYISDSLGNEIVHITSNKVFELMSGSWVQIHEGNSYYNYDPSIVYSGPEPSAQSGQVLKTWRVTGRVETQTFAIWGSTIYSPNSMGVGGELIDALFVGLPIICVGVVIAVILAIRLWKTQHTIPKRGGSL